MIYKVEVNMEELTPLLRESKVGIYSKPTTFIFIQADDPDGACEEATKKIGINILKEKNNSITQDIVAMLHDYIRVVKIRSIKHA